ncbi:MAG: glycoside hydrolase family 66 protein [Chloroflexota bacterium]|jgi:dextranase
MSRGPNDELEVWPSRAQLRPGEPLTLHASGGSGPLVVTVRDGDRAIATAEADPGQPMVVALPTLARAGLSVEARRGDRRATTAIDVASHWSVAPRYGFLSDFHPSETPEESRRRLDGMLRLHTNVVQCYDWMASHHTLVSDADEFTDPLGRRLSHAVARRKVELAHERGMAALGYGALYGAEREFSEAHRDWLLEDGLGRPISLADLFVLQDVSVGSPWRDWIIAQYVDALERIGFDGIHIDQYGFPKRAWSSATGQRRIVDVGSTFPPFVEDACQRLLAVRPDGGSIFNCVNGWPVEAMASVGSDAATYIEVWEPSSRYADLYRWVRTARTARPGKAAILAAYLAPFGPDHQREAGALTAFRLASAAIGASGGFHLIAGEGDALLTEAYYPRYGRLAAEELAVVRRYADFVVRETTRLHDGSGPDIAWTHVGPTNDLIHIDGAGDVYGAGVKPGTLWVTGSEQGDQTSLQLVNLVGLASDAWNASQPLPPRPLTELVLRVRLVGGVKGVWWDTPDDGVGVARALPHEVVETSEGRFLVARIPRVDVWASVWWRGRS